MDEYVSNPSSTGSWHPDPYGRAVQRYWNGSAWTAYVVDHQGRQGIDDPAQPGAPAYQPSATGHGIVIQNIVHSQPAYAQPFVVSGPKSKGTAFALTFLFGPLGMLYSTVSGGLIMIAVNLVVIPLTLGVGILITWPICIIWGVSAVDTWNRTHAQPVPVPARIEPTHNGPTSWAAAQPVVPQSRLPAPALPPPTAVLPSRATDERACPMCGETIKSVAVLCRYCGSSLIGGQPL